MSRTGGAHSRDSRVAISSTRQQGLRLLLLFSPFAALILVSKVVCFFAAVMLTARRNPAGGLKGLPAEVRKAVHSVTGMAVTQAALGISTLMLYVPVPLATIHQVNPVYVGQREDASDKQKALRDLFFEIAECLSRASCRG